MQLFLAILLLSCSQLGSQLFLPALPEIAQYFSITNSYTQYILMLYFMSFGLSQLIYGPWSDNVGRRKVFLIGQGVYIVGCLLAVFASKNPLRTHRWNAFGTNSKSTPSPAKTLPTKHHKTFTHKSGTRISRSKDPQGGAKKKN